MLSLRKLIISYPNQTWLPITKKTQQKSWQRSQSYSNPTTRCQAYLNDVCWQTFVPWLEAWLEKDSNESNLLERQYFPDIWEFVNGSSIDLGKTKIVLIPSDTTNFEEFDIPQEWVDISQWQADYFLAIQVNLDISDEAWIRVRGYISRNKLKEKGDFEKSDRSYYIDRKYLEEDITEIFLSWHSISHTKQELVNQKKLSPVLANQLLDKLENRSLDRPRLAIPFNQWATLITHTEWRQKLWQKRTKPTLVTISNSVAVKNITSLPIDLRNWFDRSIINDIEKGWQTIETLFIPRQPISIRGYEHPTTQEKIAKDAITPLINLLQPINLEKERIQAAGILGKIGQGHPEVISALTKLLHTAKEEETRWQAALSLGKVDPDNSHGGREKGKLIDLGLQLENQKIALIVAIAPKTKDRIGVWVQLKPISESIKLPPHLQLSIICEGETVLAAEARSNNEGEGKDQCLQFRFTPPSRTNFQVRVTLNDNSFTEYFEA